MGNIIMHQDFRTVKDTVKRVIAEINGEDPIWTWRADVLKSEIRVWWGYLQYCDKADSHFTVKMCDKQEEFVLGTNVHDEYMCGAFLGTGVGCDGDLGKCVERLLRCIASNAHSCY